jgi:hydrogenase large subunit
MVAIEAGGVTTRPTADRVLKYIELLKFVKKFVEEKYVPDVLVVAKHFKDYFKIGRGVDNFLSVNTILDLDGNYLFWDGFSKNFSTPEKVNPNEIIEYQDYSYYKRDGAFRPLELKKLVPLTLEEFKQNKKKYSWSKAPRYKDEVVEVGPAAVVINNYLRGNKRVVELVDKFNKMLGIGIRDYNSVMGRHLSRAILCKIIVEKLEEWINLVDVGELGFIPLGKVPSNVRGVGLTEATRGTLAHFTDIGENGFIRNYEMVVPTTWNISPMDGKNRHGALEQMLIGTKVKDPKNPLEIARIIRSIDPCLACSVH